MEFQHPLIRGRLVRRYKRFFADVEVEGETITVHCPNPGSLIGLNTAGAPIWLSRSDNVKRRLPYTWELIEVDGPAGTPHLVGVNTALPNRLVEEGIREGIIDELSGYDTIRREVPYGTGSRVDFLLEGPGRAPCYAEVKNVHLSRSPGFAEFPDCVTARGAKHLRELSLIAQSGRRAVMVFCVQRSDCTIFRLAHDLDPAYAVAYEYAVESGVETLIYSCHISTGGIKIATQLALAGKEVLEGITSGVFPVKARNIASPHALDS
jgi:sugar fermentation stimulation protein A